MAKARRRQKQTTSALASVRAARAAAKNALDSLREEIRGTTARLEKLIAEERSFKADLFGTAAPAARRRGRPTTRRGAKRRRRGRAKGAPKAEKFFQKLPSTFSLEDVRKIAGKRAGISLAQWSRAKRIRKAGKGYQKVAA